MIASPPIDTAVDCPRPAAVSVEDISVVMPPEREITHPGHVAAGDALGHDPHELHPILDRLEHGVLGEGGGDGHDRAVDRPTVVLDRLLDGVEHRDAVDLAALAAGGHAAHDPRPPAIVEAFAREVDRLAAGDALDDEGGRLVDQDAHQTSRSPPTSALVWRIAARPRARPPP